MLGLSWAREYIVLSSLDVVAPGIAAVNIGAGLYLVLESLVRLGVTLKSVEPLPSLPVWFLFWATDRIARKWAPQ
jgi:hypothetical protein